MKKLLYIILILSIIFTMTACGNNRDKRNQEEALEPIKGFHNGMGTVTEFIVYGNKAQEAIKQGKEVMTEIENKMSLNVEESEVNKINKQAGTASVKVSEETFEVIKRSIYFSEVTKGKFDISIAPITNLWHIGHEDERVPKNEEIEEKLSLVSYKNIRLDEENREVFLEKKGMEIDLGGIAKGYVADKIVEKFKDIGVENALVSVGGNIKVLGENPNKKRSWKVGLRHPRKARGNYFATIALQSGETVVSSGDYERYFMEGDKRYHHIFNAQTGIPSTTDVIGVSIITDDSMNADALSTSVFLLGSKKGLEFIQNLQGTEAVIVTRDLKLINTEKIEDRLEKEEL